jgi:hypothetical protein
LLRYSLLMASLLQLRVFICPPRRFTAGAEIFVLLNYHHTRGSAGTTPVHGPSGIQPTLNLNCDHLIGAGQNPSWMQTPVDGCSRLSKSCAQQEDAK